MKSDQKLEILKSTFRWIKNHRRDLNIQGVFQVGDITDDGSDAQWSRARQAFSILQGQVPFFFTTGNHDHGAKGLAETRDTKFNRYLAIDAGQNFGTFLESFEKGQLQNSAYELKFSGEHFLILALEFAPRDEVVQWAKQMAEKYPAHRRILLTHEYMDMTSAYLSRDGRSEPSTRKTYGNAHHYVLGGSTSNNGSELWKKLVHRLGWFEWVFSGHYDCVTGMSGSKPVTGEGKAFAYRAENGSDGRAVHQLMFNAQWISSGGDGWLLMIEGSSNDPEKARIVATSPWLEELGGIPSTTLKQSPIDFEIRRSP